MTFAIGAGGAASHEHAHARRLALRVLFLIVIAAGVALGGWLALGDGERPEAGAGSGGDSRDSTGGDEWRAVPGFVGSEACRSCHPEQFASYLETAHSQALDR